MRVRDLPVFPLSPTPIRPGVDPAVLAASPMDRDLFARVAADGGYALAPVRFDDGSVFFVFVRR